MTLTELRELAERATPGPRLRLWASTTVIAPFCDDIFDPQAAGPIGAQVNLDLAAACSPEVVKALVRVAEAAEAVRHEYWEVRESFEDAHEAVGGLGSFIPVKHMVQEEVLMDDLIAALDALREALA